MSRQLPLLTLLAIAFSAAAVSAQRTAYQTVEPPLADDPKAADILRLGAGRATQPYAPAVRSYDVPAPAVSLRVIAPTTLAMNQDVEVRLVVENVSRVAARNLLVVYGPPKDATPVKSVPPSVADPAYQGCSVWKIENLAAGGRQEIALTLKPAPGTAQIDSKARVILDQEQSVRTKFAKTELKLLATGPKQAQRFDILVVGVTVTNPSDVELHDLTITDKLPPGLVHRADEDKDRPYTQGPSPIIDGGITDGGQTRTWKINRLAPKESRRIEYYVATTTATGVVERRVFAQAAGSAQDTATDKVELFEPKMELKVDAPPRKLANLAAPVRITLTNTGSRVLQNIVVTDLLDPCKLETVSGGGQQLSDRVQWIVPTLRPNQPQAFDLTVSKADGGIVRHKVTAIYRGATLPAEAQTQFEAAAVLAYDFRGTPTTIEVNGEVIYEITVRNTGSAAATNIRASIELPPELSMVKAEPENKVAAGKVAFEPIAKLPPNERATFRVTAKAVHASVGAVVKAELGGDPFPTGPVKRQEMTAIGGAPAAPIATVPAGSVPLPVPVAPPPRP